MLECVQSFRQLHTLSLWSTLIPPGSFLPSSGSRLQSLIPVLCSVHDHTPLRTLEVYCTGLAGTEDFSYFTSREGLLDMLSDVQLTGALQRFAALEDLHFILDENDLNYGSLWWTAQLALRLPDPLRSIVSVDVRLFAGCECFHVEYEQPPRAPFRFLTILHSLRKTPMEDGIRGRGIHPGLERHARASTAPPGTRSGSVRFTDRRPHWYRSGG